MQLWEGPQVDAYFDDVSFSHTPSPVVAVNDYYPFGLGYGNWQRDGAYEQRTLYNSKELQDELAVNWYDYGARMYMPEIGRWGVVDPKADRAHDLTPYRYSFNNPVMFIDPDGQWEVNVGYGQTMDHRDVSGSIDHYGGITPTERDFAQGSAVTSVVDNVRQLGKEWSSHVSAVYGQNAQIENVEEKFAAWVVERVQLQEVPETWYLMRRDGAFHALAYDPYREVIYEVNNPDEESGFWQWLDAMLLNSVPTNGMEFDGTKSTAFAWRRSDKYQWESFWEREAGNTYTLTPVTIPRPTAATAWFQSHVGNAWNYNFFSNNCFNYACQGFAAGGGPAKVAEIPTSFTMTWTAGDPNPRPRKK